MTTVASAPAPVVGGIRTALAVGGALALIVGVLILVWPGKTAMVVTAIIAVYAIVAGLVYACLGIFSNARSGWSRVGHIVLGLLFIAAGVVAFMNLSQATSWLAVFLGVLVGIMWVVEGITALSTLGDAASKGWSIFFAILSIIAGFMVMFSPMWGIAILWWLLGISFIVLGVVNVVRAVSFGSKRRRSA